MSEFSDPLTLKNLFVGYSAPRLTNLTRTGDNRCPCQT